MKLKIPAELNDSFDRLMRLATPELAENETFQKTTLAYLALGGESLARQNIAVSRMIFPDGEKVFEYTPIAEPVADSDDAHGDNDEKEDAS